MATLVFDVNETLSDVAGLTACFETIGLPGSLGRTWFASTLRDGFALAVHGDAAGFADVGRQVLLGLLAGYPDVDPGPAVDTVLTGFGELDAHPDVTAGLRRLADAGHRLVTLSVGAATVAESLLRRADVADCVELTLSCEDAGIWKPHPAAYRWAAHRCGLPPAQLTMVAVHPWDLDGAARAGLSTALVDRTGAPWPAVFRAPDHRVRAVGELVDVLT